MKIAITYDKGQPFTTGIYCRKALESLGHTVDFYDRKRVIFRPYDLVIKVDDGTDSLFKVMPWHRTAFWAIDTHTDMDRLCVIARRANFLFCAQKVGIELFSERGFGGAVWLPLAGDPEEAGAGARDLYDIAYVGTIKTDKRRRMETLVRRLSGKVFFGRAPREEISRVYSRAFIGVNTIVNNDVNMRTFEVTINGALLLMERVHGNGMEELYREGSEYIAYDGEKDLAEKVKEILADRVRYEPIRKAGMERALRDHTYEMRMKRLLEHIE